MLKKPKNSTAIEVREFLRKTQPNFPFQVWRELKRASKIHSRYQSFMVYWRCLERLNLIQRVPSPKSKTEKKPGDTVYFGRLKPHYPRTYFVLNSQKLQDPSWLSPQRYLFPLNFKLLSNRGPGRPVGNKNRSST